ncbi:PF06147 family protein [Selenomonas sp. FOBRC9]|uniref:putative HNHc nuclease n=1 Tax=Selenomonas sp. FOBRC9 TaxID=936573 RepID=UPI00027A603C|nr:putative HNHc nuclease [Selenomonas sp. FOBRC9]EJP32295.1 PF06147 family protein [Selenomonas sp. FOBRC9]
MILSGKVVQEAEEGFLILLPAADKEALKGKYRKGVNIELVDPRRISPEQRRKAYALIRDIALWMGGTPMETVKEFSKWIFQESEMATLEGTFSLSDCSVEVARLYITFLIDFCLLHDVPCNEPLYKLAEDIPRYVWVCLMNKRCAVCGRKAELHHVDCVGMGRNRKEICHIGMRVLPLCRTHHTEIHKIGHETFLRRYILEPVKVDERIADVYKLRKE